MIAVPTVMDLTELAEFVFGPDSLVGTRSLGLHPEPKPGPSLALGVRRILTRSG